MRHECEACVQALSACEAPDEARDISAARLSHDRQRHGENEKPPDTPESAHVDREPEDEEKQGTEQVAEAEEALLDLSAGPGAGEDDAGHKCADRLGEAKRVSERSHPDQEREGREQEELARQPVEELVEGASKPAGGRE